MVIKPDSDDLYGHLFEDMVFNRQQVEFIERA